VFEDLQKKNGRQTHPRGSAFGLKSLKSSVGYRLFKSPEMSGLVKQHFLKRRHMGIRQVGMHPACPYIRKECNGEIDTQPKAAFKLA
jgi:hypothetical protein